MARSGRPQGRRSTGWGWHQLNHEWTERLVDRSGVGPGDLVLDIGAGRGALTAPLVETGARVIAVELHPSRAAGLRRRFGSDVVVVQADAANLRLPRRPFIVVSNPPFAVTTALLLRILQPGSRLERGLVLVQHQAARRWTTAEAPRFNRWGRHYSIVSPIKVPRSAFRPRPTVDVRLLEIRRLRTAGRHGPRPGGRRGPGRRSS